MLLTNTVATDVAEKVGCHHHILASLSILLFIFVEQTFKDTFNCPQDSISNNACSSRINEETKCCPKSGSKLQLAPISSQIPHLHRHISMHRASLEAH